MRRTPHFREIYLASRSVLATHAASFWGAVLAFSVPMSLVAQVLVFDKDNPNWSVLGLNFILMILVGTLFQVLTTAVAVAAHEKRELSLGEAFSRSWGLFLNALLAGFLYFVAMGLGLLLLLIPALIVSTYLCLYMPALVRSDLTAREALEESYASVKGRWWRVSIQLSGVFLFVLLGVVLLSLIAAFTLPKGSYLMTLVQEVLTYGTSGFIHLFIANIYLLSLAEEAPSSEAAVEPAPEPA